MDVLDGKSRVTIMKRRIFFTEMLLLATEMSTVDIRNVYE